MSSLDMSIKRFRGREMQHLCHGIAPEQDSVLAHKEVFHRLHIRALIVVS
jgi:hypothetical protein